MKKFIQDKVLFLLSLLQVSVSLLVMVYSLLKIDGDKATIVTRYRPTLGLSGAFVQGDAIDLYAFTVLAFVLCAGSIFLAYRLYNIKREYSLFALILGLTLAIFNARVMYAILGIK